MSNIANDNLLELAADLIDQWQGTTIADILEKYIDDNDLEGLYSYIYDVKFAEIMSQANDEPHQTPFENLSEDELASVSEQILEGF